MTQILAQPPFELVSSVLALEATEPVSEPVIQMAHELIIDIFLHFCNCV